LRTHLFKKTLLEQALQVASLDVEAAAPPSAFEMQEWVQMDLLVHAEEAMIMAGEWGGIGEVGAVAGTVVVCETSHSKTVMIVIVGEGGAVDTVVDSMVYTVVETVVEIMADRAEVMGTVGASMVEE